jgi:hypothetical protein
MLGIRLKEDLAPAAANLTSSSRHAIGLTGSGRLHRNIQASHQRHSAGDGKHYSAEDKIRIVLDGLRGEYPASEKLEEFQ